MQPDLDGIERRVLATAGRPDTGKVARFAAWAAGSPPPPGTAADLAAIDAMPPALDGAEMDRWDRHG